MTLLLAHVTPHDAILISLHDLLLLLLIGVLVGLMLGMRLATGRLADLFGSDTGRRDASE